MHDDAAQGVRRKKDSTLVRAAEAVRDGTGERDDLGRQHRRHDGVGAAADGPHQRRQPPGDRHADPRARVDSRRSCSTPAPTPRCSPTGWCSSPRWARSSPGTASASPNRGSACCRSARSPARATRCARRRTRCSSKAPGHRLHRQRRGPRRDDRRRRRGRHRRVHRQRRAEDARRWPADGRPVAARGVRLGATEVQAARRRADAGAAAAVRRRSIPRPTAGRSCSVSTGCASSPTARRASERSSTPSSVAREMVEAAIVDEIRTAIAGGS